MGGQQHTRQQCLIKTLELDDQHAQAWDRFRLGHSGGGSVDGQHYTYKQCHTKALEVDDQHFDAWNWLAFYGGGSMGGQQYTSLRQQCWDKRNEIRAAA